MVPRGNSTIMHSTAARAYEVTTKEASSRPETRPCSGKVTVADHTCTRFSDCKFVIRCLFHFLDHISRGLLHSRP